MKNLKNEFGRSMVEMLGVLAVVGLLSVMAFAGFKIALNKAKANAIVHDGRKAWVEALAWQNIPTPTDWIDSRYALESGKKFSARRDIKDNHYVKVEGVEEEVCERMLPMQQKGNLIFLTTNYEDFTSCEEGDDNAIVMAFDGLSGKPAECVNQKGCQDLYSDAFYCDGDGHCQECDAAISVVNAAGDGCECRSSARSCDNDGEHVWCCPNEQICGNKLNECVTCADPLTMANEEGTACVCDPTIAVSCDDGQGHTWCCGGIQICGTNANQCVDSEGSQCHYYLMQSNETPRQYTNCSYTLGSEYENGVEQGKLTPSKANQCHENEYCYLNYTDTECRSDTEASAGATGTLYGTCIPVNMVIATCNTDLSSDAFALQAKTGCPAGTYCFLKWTEDSCSTEAVASDVGDLYGKCVDYNTVNPNSCS